MVGVERGLLRAVDGLERFELGLLLLQGRLGLLAQGLRSLLACSVRASTMKPTGIGAGSVP